MDRSSPSDPSDESVNRLGKKELPASNAPSLPFKTVKSLAQQWGMDPWASVAELYHQAPDDDHGEALLGFIDRYWQGDEVPMSLIRHSLRDSGEPMAVLMLRDLARILLSETYARRILARLLGRFGPPTLLMVKKVPPQLAEKVYGNIQPKEIRAFALRHFDTLDIAWRTFDRVADSGPLEESLQKAMIRQLQALADAEDE